MFLCLEEKSHTKQNHQYNQALLSEQLKSTTSQRQTKRSQGYVLSPHFNVVLNDVMKSALDGNMGIPWRLTNHLQDLNYADDICPLSPNFNQMQTKLTKLVKQAEKVGLTINVKKTKSMRIFNNNDQNFNINDESAEDVTHFTYLGSFILRNGDASESAMIRVNKASHSFSLLRCTWNSTQYVTSPKIQIFQY